MVKYGSQQRRLESYGVIPTAGSLYTYHKEKKWENKINWSFLEGLGLPAVQKPTVSAISSGFHSFAWALAMLPFPV